MGGFLEALLGISGSVVARVLLSLGMAVVTVTGVAVVISTAKAQMLSSLGAIPTAAMQLIGLSGGWIALGIIFGAMTTCVSYWTITKATSILGK